LKTKEQLDMERLERAKEIAEAVKAGEYQPAAFDKMASFFPSRPKIKKDQELIKKLYGDDK
tara:strand:- start:1980 stop:2162 length:183 start_codon:yes stop_codon:yes gene_type:complete